MSDRMSWLSFWSTARRKSSSPRARTRAMGSLVNRRSSRSQDVGPGRALGSLKKNGLAEEHVGRTIDQALNTGVIAVDRNDLGVNVESIGALAQPVDGPGIGDHREGLCLEQSPRR